jgi:hypothetical protein
MRPRRGALSACSSLPLSFLGLARVRVTAILVLFLLFTACATDSPGTLSVDASDTGSRVVLASEGEPPLVLRPAPRRAPVEVTRAEYEAAMVHLAREVRDKLLAAPEPVSKVIVISLTLGLVAYVGWDTLVGLIEGWKRLDQEAKKARTFAEVREAGARYGRVMGEKVSRLLIMLATAALGGAGGKAINPPGGRLPGFAQASRLAVAEGVPMQVAGQVKTVKVTGRILTVAMEPGVVFMSSRGMSNGGGGSSSASTPRSPATGLIHCPWKRMGQVE